MTRLGVLLVVALAVGGATASAGPPPPTQVLVGVTRAQPVVEQLFTGLTVTRLSTRITFVRCDAQIDGKIVHSRVLRFYVNGVAGPTAVSCSWQVPASANGKELRTHVVVQTASQYWAGANAHWRVR